MFFIMAKFLLPAYRSCDSFSNENLTESDCYLTNGDCSCVGQFLSRASLQIFILKTGQNFFTHMYSPVHIGVLKLTGKKILAE
jgi:hypothetical protein